MPRSKALDSLYLLLSASALVGVVLAFTVILITYDDAPWMPHGDRAKQLQIAIFAFGLGALCAYGTWDARRAAKALEGTPHLSSLAALHTPWWAFLTGSILGFGTAAYSFWLFMGGNRTALSRSAVVRVQLMVGVTLLVSGAVRLIITLRGRKIVPITRSVVLFGVIVPAFLIIAGVVQVFSAWSH